MEIMLKCSFSTAISVAIIFSSEECHIVLGMEISHGINIHI